MGLNWREPLWLLLMLYPILINVWHFFKQKNQIQSYADKALLPLSFEMISEARREGELPEDYFTHQKLLPELKLVIESTHIADVYLPRTVAIVRHSAA